MIRRDPLFKGCTRPPMLFGVPLLPLVVVAAVDALFVVWFTLLFITALPVAVAIMRAIVRSDEQRFRQLALWFRFRFLDGNRRFWGGCSSYSPLTISRRW